MLASLRFGSRLARLQFARMGLAPTGFFARVVAEQVDFGARETFALKIGFGANAAFGRDTADRVRHFFAARGHCLRGAAVWGNAHRFTSSGCDEAKGKHCFPLCQALLSLFVAYSCR
jgi:hypothetical protein